MLRGHEVELTVSEHADPAEMGAYEELDRCRPPIEAEQALTPPGRMVQSDAEVRDRSAVAQECATVVY
jgi:hypothetical protein